MAKRAGAESQFCVVPRKSIKLVGESVGINYLSSEVAASLAEDASYRIRQTVQSAGQFVKHSKRDHMTGQDINRALLWSRIEPIYGYGSKNSNIFSSISTKDGDLYFHEDKEINLRELAFSKGFSSLAGLGSCEINVEVSVLDKASSSKSNSQSDLDSSRGPSKEFESLNPVVKSYYDQVTRNIIAVGDQAVKVIFHDLRTNGRIQVLLPYLVNFISTAMQILIDDSQKLLRVFGLVKALIENKHLYLEPYVVQFVRAIMYCLIEKPVSKISTSWLDDQILRNRAAQTLCHIDRKCNNAGNCLHLQLIRTFKDIYNANDRPLHSQYGAVTGLAFLGVDAVQQTIFPHLKEYSEHLVNLQDTDPTPETQTGVLHILDILKMSTITVFRNKLRTIAVAREKQEQVQKSRGNKAPTNGADTTYKSCLVEQKKWNQNVPEWYQQMYNVTGDALVLLLGNLEDYEKFILSKNFVANNPRTSLLNHSRLQYIRRMIQNALQTRKQKSSVVLEFSLHVEKSRRVHELSMSDEVDVTQQRYLTFLDNHNSELRFETLLRRSIRPISNFDLKARTVRLPCLSTRRTSFRRSIALLSFLF